MNRLEILKAFLEDTEMQQKYGFVDTDLEKMTNFSLEDPTLFVSLVKAAIQITENDSLTINTAASNLNSFLENRLR